MDGGGAGDIARVEAALHFADLAGDDVARHGDDAVATEAPNVEGVVVVAAPYLEIEVPFADAFDERRGVGEVTIGFFIADDIWKFGQPEDGGGRHIDPGAAWHVVNDDRQRRAFGDDSEVLVD